MYYYACQGRILNYLITAIFDSIKASTVRKVAIPIFFYIYYIFTIWDGQLDGP